MKKGLLHKKSGKIVDVASETFPVHKDFKWVNVKNHIMQGATKDKNGEWQNADDIEVTKPRTEEVILKVLKERGVLTNDDLKAVNEELAKHD